MSDVRLGERPEGDQRDAVHVAIVAGQLFDKSVQPSERVHWHRGRVYKLDAFHGKSNGIVDPFLEGEIRPYDWVWILANPNPHTKLSHQWHNEDFPEELPEERYQYEDDGCRGC